MSRAKDQDQIQIQLPMAVLIPSETFVENDMLGPESLSGRDRRTHALHLAVDRILHYCSDSGVAALPIGPMYCPTASQPRSVDDQHHYLSDFSVPHQVVCSHEAQVEDMMSGDTVRYRSDFVDLAHYVWRSVRVVFQ